MSSAIAEVVEKSIAEQFGVPTTLAELIASDHVGYKLKRGYVLQLSHGCMGFFPAICVNTGKPIITTDKELIFEIWKMLTPRGSKLSPNVMYANDEMGIGYPILGDSDHDLNESHPQEIVTRTKFHQILADTKPPQKPFKWAPGLVGNDMSLDEFRETLELAAKKHEKHL